jgi:glyoxalase family protein
MKITGLHHVTAIASDPQRNLDFYVGLLGLRLVKRTINFDDPGSYHFYFGDAVGTPGTILTFFPWPSARRGVHGSGEVESTAFAIPENSVSYWLERLKAHQISAGRVTKRFGEEVIRFADSDGMVIDLIASDQSDTTRAWIESPVPPEHAIQGLHSVSAALNDCHDTAAVLTDIFGYRLTQTEGNRTRFVAENEGNLARTIDLIHTPDSPRGQAAAGSVHHIAFRTANDEEQLTWRKKLTSLGFGVSPVMDRTYFNSIYFREPGGVLFEIATDPPGFTKDESLEELGTNLRLPAWLESSRPRIETLLPKITLPTKTTV